MSNRRQTQERITNMQTATQSAPAKRHKFRTGISFGDGIDIDSLATQAKSAPEAFARRAAELIKTGDLRLGKLQSLPSLQRALMPLEVKTVQPVGGQTQAIMASAFPLLTGMLAVAELNEEYDKIPTIGQELVRDQETNKRVTTTASVFAMDVDEEKVAEGQDFPEIGASEEEFQIRSLRSGRKLTVTQEMIDENDVAGIVDRINALAYIANTRVEEQTLDRICDHHGSATSPTEPYVLRPNGSGTSLYSTTANTPGTRAPSGTRINSNALVDNTDLDAARARLTTMLDSLGKRILIPMSETIVLVPDALIGTLMSILNSELVPGVENEVANWGPRGMWRPRPLSSPKLDDISTTTWYMGNFKRQFKRMWNLQFEYVTLSGPGTQEFLNRRIGFQARIAWSVEVGATDYNQVVQCLSATTAP